MATRARIFDKNFSGNPDSPMSGPRLAVAAQLQPILQMDGGGQTAIVCVKHCLEASHPGKVVQTSSATDYVIIWNGGKWCRVCLPSAEFEITHSAGDVTVVQVSQSSHYTTGTQVTLT